MCANLLKQTLMTLKENNKEDSDVLWVGNEDTYFSWSEFESIAKDCNYDDGYGGAEVVTDLIVCGDGFWLERGEYDGSEWWEFKKLPVKPETYKKPTKLIKGSWGSLSDED